MFENEYIKHIKPYSLVSHKAWEIEDKSKVLKLDWNEATIPPSPKVFEYITNFLKKGFLNWYPDTNNRRLLRLLSKYTQLPIENLQYFAGSDSLHEYIATAFLSPGDTVVIVSPTYDNFRLTVELRGGNVKFYYLDSKLRFNLEDFKRFLEKITPKMVYICNPNNPTGTIYEVSIIEDLLKNFPNILFLIDEAYYEFGGVSCKDLVIKFNNLIISRTFSKAFALAGFRIAYAISSSYNINILNKVRNPKSISTLSQIAAVAALEDIEYMKNYVKEVLIAKEWFRKALKNLGIEAIGDGGNFLLLKIGKEKKEPLIKFLEKHLIFIRDYSHVKGMGDFVRITIGTKKQMEKVLDTIKEFIAKYGY